jgi:2-oxoisovalerate dehydrogenase E1 component
VADRLENRYKTALLIRAVEERLLSLFAEGRLNGTVHTCIGQELTGVAVAEALGEDDLVVSNHRCHGHYIARTGDVDGLVGEVMGRANGVCGGRGGSQHLHNDGFYSNGVQGGIAPVSVGMAYERSRRGLPGIVAVFLGDGTLGEGVVYESLNLAAKWKLPVLFVLENNRVAQSTAQETTLAGSIDARAEAFGIATAAAATWEPDALFETAAAAVEAVRSGKGPFFLRIDTDRLKAHSKGDDDRPADEVRELEKRDPLVRYREVNPGRFEQLEAEAAKRVSDAVDAAEAAGPASDAGEEDDAGWKPVSWSPVSPAATGRVVGRVNEAFAAALEGDERVSFIGEDLEDPYGGAFKATKGLSARFPGRVRNAPISEAALVGTANGAALAGGRPVVEIMFGDFIALAADQWINHAAKFGTMYGNETAVPFVLRTPMGGRRGYGPTHSQSLEKHFLGLPGTRVVALNGRLDPKSFYDSLFATLDRPTLVVENKLLYGAPLDAPVPAGFTLRASDEPFPTVRLSPDGAPDATLFCWGGALAEAEHAARTLFEEEEIALEIVCAASLYPFNAAPLLESVEKSGRLLVFEEDLAFASLGAEAGARLLERAPGSVKRFARLASARRPIPSAKPLEAATLPGAGEIVESVKELVHE